MSTMKNAGYDIIDRITVNKETYVLGHNPNPNAGAPYVTWFENNSGPNTFYVHGNYHTTEQAAKQDLLLRAMESMREEDRMAFVRKAMPDSLRREIIEEATHAGFMEDIESCLESALNYLGIDLSVGADLMKDEAFCARALNVYFKQDHSAENEALAESLENLIEEHYPHLLPKAFTANHKISPEEMEILTDALSLTVDQAADKYGPFENAEGLLLFSTEIKSPTGEKAYMDISFNLKEHETDTPSANIFLDAGTSLFPQKQGISTTVENITSPEQIYSITDEKGRTWNVDLHADERLRRLGKEFVFKTDILDTKSEYYKHDGETCTVERMLVPGTEHDLLFNLMWKARFEDGTVLDVFDSELTLPRDLRIDIALHPDQQKPVQKQSLDALINHAIGKAGKEVSERSTTNIPNHAEPSVDR